MKTVTITEEFKKYIDEDIAKCEETIKNGNKTDMKNLHATLVSKYGNIIDGFKEDLRSLFYDETGSSVRCNLETMKQKLQLFKSMGYANIYAKHDTGVTFNNTNQLTANINITFSEVREKIENMSALQDSEIEEILSKIEELEEIVQSSERKTKKWEKAKGIIKWVADKGVDVGISLLPLILKIGEM